MHSRPFKRPLARSCGRRRRGETVFSGATLAATLKHYSTFSSRVNSTILWTYRPLEFLRHPWQKTLQPDSSITGKNSLSRIFCIRADTPVLVVCTAQVSLFPIHRMSIQPYRSTLLREKAFQYSHTQGFMPCSRRYSKDRWVGDAMYQIYNIGIPLVKKFAQVYFFSVEF